MKKKFPIYLEYDLEYGGYVADCPTLPGCMSQGKTKKEALKNIQGAIKGYLKVLKKHKKTTFDPRSRGTSTRTFTGSD